MSCTVSVFLFLLLLPGQGLLADWREEVVTKISEKMEERGIPGLSVAVSVKGDLQLERAFGLADVENGVPATPRTLYRTASIAKSFTAVLALDLHEEGKLDLDAPVRKTLPDFPEKPWPITSRQLLGHLGGVRHYQKVGEANGTRHFRSVEEALELFADDPLLHEPGTRFHYTTYGYNLVGHVVEVVGGADFATLLQKRIAEPAGLSSTRLDSHYDIIPHRTRGYWRFRIPGSGDPQGRLLNAHLHDTSMKVPGGGLLSTPGDLVRFAHALTEGKILEPETLEMMWTSLETRDGEKTGYGLGWRVRQEGERKIVSHSGGQAGTSTRLVLAPAEQVAVAVMCNLRNAEIGMLAQEILEVVLERDESK